MVHRLVNFNTDKKRFTCKIYMMEIMDAKNSDKEYLDILKEVNSYKDAILESSLNIIYHLKKPSSIGVDHYIIEIMNSLGKIGTITGNAGLMNAFSDSWYDALSSVNRMDEESRKMLLPDLLNRLCMVSFEIKKNGKKIEIKLPKIEINLQKFET